MTRGINKVFLIGNLGTDPEIRYASNGTALCTFSLATNEVFNDRENIQQERTEWHRIVIWGKLAETCKKYLFKGSQIYLEGSIRTRSWEDKTGSKRWVTEINTKEIKFLNTNNNSHNSNEPTNSTTSIEKNDVPF